MDNRFETEEEMRARLKEELKAELLAELKAEQNESPQKKPSYQSPQETLKISRSSEQGVKEATDLLNKDMNFKKKEDGPKSFKLPQANDNETGTLSVVLIVVVILLIVASFFVAPKIYQYFASQKEDSNYVDPNKDDDKDEEIVLEKITLTSDTVLNLTYPIMRNNPYTKSTYYNKKVFNVGDFTNNDILYNAFIDIYIGNIAQYTGIYSGNACITAETMKTFNAKYIDARIANLFTKSVEYKHQDFKVPSTNENTSYVGLWKYDAKNNRYIYYGDCEPLSDSTIHYYNLEVAYDAKGVDKNNFLEVYYYVAFAKVNTSTKQYNIYSDAKMENQLATGTLTTTDYKTELNQILNTYIESNSVGQYKYTFSNQDCSYQNYCFVKGEWLEEN